MNRLLISLALALGGMARLAPAAIAQTDYYNTDAGRPVLTEDALPVEYRALELQLAPVRLERARGGLYTWSIEPELAAGILPRTQLELGAVLNYVDAGAARASGLAGIELSVLHNLNTETAIPALGIAADVLIPAGNLAPSSAYGSFKGILTKTFHWARIHVNGQYTIGEEPADGERGVDDVSRWLAGFAVDHTFPLRSTLLTAEVVTRQPIHDDEDVEWIVGAGMRYQFTPRWALDGGVGRRLTGAERSWYVTFGAAYVLGFPWQR